MRKMFPRYAKNIVAGKEKTVFEIVTKLYSEGYTDIVMVVGSDRVKEFTSLIMKYNGVNGRHGFYDFETIDVVSAGERDPDAEGCYWYVCIKDESCFGWVTLTSLNLDYHLVSKMHSSYTMMFVSIWVFVKNEIWVR